MTAQTAGLTLQGNNLYHIKVKEVHMDRKLRGIAGFFILASLLLARYVNINWLWFTAFVGLNLFQSAFTNWCPMMWFLKKTGLDKG